METAETQEVVSTPAGGGEAHWWLGALATIKLANPDLTLVEIQEAPAAEAPLHVHHNEDEGFWVLEGEVTFEAGGQIVHGTPGAFVFGPRNVPHRYTVGPLGARMLFIFAPGGFEGFIRVTGRPASSRELPPPEVEPVWDSVMASLYAYGTEILEG